MSFEHHPTALAAPNDSTRKISISYCNPESQVVITEVPITPPLSPKAFISKSDILSLEDMSMVASTTTPIQLRSEQLAMDVDQATQDAPMTPISPIEEQQPILEPSSRPLRKIEDQKDRLQTAGLKLSDFEVRGTLGA
jgi:hypothetical protein